MEKEELNTAFVKVSSVKPLEISLYGVGDIFDRFVGLAAAENEISVNPQFVSLAKLK